MTNARARELFPSDAGKMIGIPLGERRPLFDECFNTSGISLEFVGTRMFKTMRAISSLAFWHDSRIVFDPAQEIAPMMWRFLTAQGQRVLIMNPDADPKDRDGNPYPWAPFIACTNVIGWIDTTDPLAAMHIHTIASLFFEMDSIQKTDNGEFFSGTAESMLAALIAHTLWDEGKPEVIVKTSHRWLSMDGDDHEETVIYPAERPFPRNLRTVCAYLSLPDYELRIVLKYIYDHSPSSLARHYAGPLVDGDPKTFSSILHTCHQATRWLAIDALADMVCGDDFSITDIATDPNLALFIQPPMTVCNKHKGIVRLIFGALMNAKIVNPDETFPLVLTDESWLIRVEAIREMILNGGKYHIALHMIWQSIGSLDRVWGRDTRKEFFDGAAWIAVGPVGDVDSAREISEACGTFGALEHSAGDNTSVQAGTSLWGRWSKGDNQGSHPVKRNVLFLHETMQDLHRGIRLILRLPQPLIVGAGPYWEIPILRDMIDPSPYARVRPEKKPWYWISLWRENS